ncbi:UNVERIFIED_CONTAM: hypothetical protein Sindi_2879300 [Sesamum indicum]
MSKSSSTLIIETNKFNGTNYNDWLQNLRIVLDFENQAYVLDKLDDILPIMLNMMEVYAVLDRHIRYAATKAFFGTKMAEGSSMQSHGIKMLAIVEKLDDLKAGLDNDTYIDATNHKSTSTVLVGEASTSKAKGKRVRRWKREKGKGTAFAATASALSAPTVPLGMGKRKGKVGGFRWLKENDVCIRCQRKGH